jgi:hypothetical protein
MPDVFQMRIELGKVREFTRATGALLPEYTAADAPVPPTFLTTAAFFWDPLGGGAAAQLGFDLSRVMHAEEEYVFHGPPPRIGTTLNVMTRLGEQWTKTSRRGGELRFGLIIREFRDSAGVLVAEQRTTAVEVPA